MLNLPQNRLLPTLLVVDEASIQRRLNGEDKLITGSEQHNISKSKEGWCCWKDQYLEEGRLFDLSLLQVAEESMPKFFW